MQTSYRPLFPNDRIYAHGSNPVSEFESLNIGSSRPGRPTNDAPIYIGVIFTRRTVPGTSAPLWDDSEIPDTQEELERKLSKWKSKSVDYSGTDMDHAGKRDAVDRFIKRKNDEYPGYDYRLRVIQLEIKKNRQNKRISTQIKVILQRQPTTKAKLKSQSEVPKHDLRDPSIGLPIRKPTQAPYYDDSVGYRNEDLNGDAGISGTQYRPHHQYNRSQNMPSHAPDHYIPTPPPPPAYPGLHFPASQHAQQGEDPRFQTPHHQGERFDGPAQNNPFPEPHFNNTGPPMQNPHVSFEDQQNHGGLGNHPNMQGENNNPRPVSRAGDRFNGSDHHAYPNGQTEQPFHVNEEFLNHPRGGGGPPFEEFQGNQPHLHPQSRKENRSGDSLGGVYGAGRNTERNVHRDSGFFSGASDGARSESRNDQDFPKAYAEPRGKKAYTRDHQYGHQKDNYHSRNRSKDHDSDSNWNPRKHHSREQSNHKSRRRDSHQSLSSGLDEYESDYNGRTASFNKNRQNRRNSSRSMNKEYGDVRSNEYLTPGEDSDWYSEDESFHSSRGLNSPPTFRRSKRTPNVRLHDPRDQRDILDEREHEWKRREEKRLREEREERMRHLDKLKLDRELEGTRNTRESKGRRSSGGTLPRSRRSTHRQSDRYH